MPSFALLGSLAVLAVALAAVVRAPGGRREVVWTAPAAVLVVATGLVGPRQAADAVGDLAPTLVFLAAMFVIARVADAAGLFAWMSGSLARAGGLRGGMLAAVAVGAVAVTTVLSLDATAVLFTPVVVATVRRRRDRDRSLLATVFLANGASLLLPIANLTNLLAYEQLGLTFPEFAARMALPTLAAAAVITIGCRYLTPMVDVDEPARLDHAATGRTVSTAEGSVADGSDLDATAAPVRRVAVAGTSVDDADGPGSTAGGATRRDARWAGAGLVLLLAAFVTASVVGIEPALVAAVGAVVLGGTAVARRLVPPSDLVRSADPAFLAFVATLGIVVAAPAEQGLTQFVADRLPAGHDLPALLLVAFGAALLANLLTNLPATLVLLPALVGRGPGLLLAALIGVNIGPNLTVTGSLATLLWRRVVRTGGVEPARGTFVRVSLATTPVAILAATVALWASGRLA